MAILVPAVRFLVLSVVTSTVLFISCLPVNADDERDKPVVSVNGVVLTEKHLAQVMQKIVPVASFHGGLSERKLKKYRPQAIKALVDDELMFQRAEELSMKVERSKTKAAHKATIERLGGKRPYKAALKSYGITDRKYKASIRRKLMIEKFIKEKIEQPAAVSEEEVREHYDNNSGVFMLPEARRVRHIFVKVPSQSNDEQRAARKVRAEMVLEKLHAGEDFATLAWDYSNGPYRVKGGDMGLLHKGRLDPKLEDEVVKLKEGELSGVIQTPYGFHIVRVESIQQEQQLPFEKVKDKIRSSKYDRRLEEVREEVMSSLREKADIEVFQE
ncbi:MAG: peptidylprolyl isomerase [Thermodesulfovibrionales bacterium]|nr:peptidylprolyl isomerase [Thermodesulfovibrionales bacterium]